MKLRFGYVTSHRWMKNYTSPARGPVGGFTRPHIIVYLILCLVWLAGLA